MVEQGVLVDDSVDVPRGEAVPDLFFFFGGGWDSGFEWIGTWRENKERTQEKEDEKKKVEKKKPKKIIIP